MSLIKIAKQTIKKYKLLNKNEAVVVGVSGGPDSVALLFLLNSLKTEFKLKLHVAHLDHQLRKNSSQDEKFVKSLALRLGLGFSSARIDVARLNKNASLEETARLARLKFFSVVAKNVGAKKIALGHNQDDQAETVLMRLIRGTGLYGLSSILPKRKINRCVVIRPLIELPRSVIQAYLNRRKIKPRIDPSNKKSLFFRNRIRNKLLPELSRSYNPKIKTVLANTALTAACDYAYLEKTAKRALKRIKKPLRGRNYASGIRFELDEFLRLDECIQRLVLRFCVAEIKGTIRRLSFKHIQEIEDLILSRPLNSIVDLPQGVAVLKHKKYLFIYQKRL